MLRNVLIHKKQHLEDSENVKINNKIAQKLLNYGVVSEEDIVNKSLLNSKLEEYLINEIKGGSSEAFFQLGQIYFDSEQFEKSIFYFQEGVKKFRDFQCMFQLGVQYYDGLGIAVDPEMGCAYLKRILASEGEAESSHLIFPSAYNLGRAYYEGFGVKQSDTDAERMWLLAADDGNPTASVMAQSALGFFYSTPQHLDFNKAFFWHSEACGNGSIESQACLGVMYLYGLGVRVNWEAALVCLSNAADRGSVYAQGNLCYYFYKRKLFTKAADLSAKVSQLELDELETMSHQSATVILEYLRKGVAIACFIFARCLHFGSGVRKDCDQAQNYYSKSFFWDADLCSDFQKLVTLEQL